MLELLAVASMERRNREATQSMHYHLLKKNINQKPHTSGGDERNFAKRIGKTTAREFIEKNTVFPNREDFIIDKYEHSFSSILDKKIPNDSYLKQEKYFNVFFITNIPYWFKCCNEARGDLVSRSKDRYFSKLTLNGKSCAQEF